MPKFVVTVDCNQAHGFQVFGIEAPDKETALDTFYEGDIVFEEYEIGWDRSYGKQPEPEIEEVEEFDLGYHQGIEVKNKQLQEQLTESLSRERKLQRWICTLESQLRSAVPHPL